jgi:oligosaccharide repeat unit polymerase
MILYNLIDGDFSKLEDFKKLRVLNGIASFETSGLLQIFFSINVLVVAFLYFILIGVSFFRRNQFIIYSFWILTLCFINDLTFVSRTLTYNMAILFIFILTVRQFKFSFYKLTTILLIFLVGMHFISENSRNEKREIKGIQLPTGLVQLIDYNCGPIVSYNLTKNYSSDDLYYGQFTFMGFVQVYNIFSNYDLTIHNDYFKWSDNAEYITRSEDHRRTLNTYTWIRYLKSDFGYLGLIIIPLLTSIIWNLTRHGHRVLNRNSFMFYFLVLLIFRSNQQIISDTAEFVALFIFVPFRGIFFKITRDEKLIGDF